MLTWSSDRAWTCDILEAGFVISVDRRSVERELEIVSSSDQIFLSVEGTGRLEMGDR